MTDLSPQFEETLPLLDLQLDDYAVIVNELLEEIDAILSMTAGHQIVSASEIADKLLDLRIIVSKLQPK